MNVAQLIEKLRTMPQDAPVCWADTDISQIVEAADASLSEERYLSSDGIKSGAIVIIGDRQKHATDE